MLFSSHLAYPIKISAVRKAVSSFKVFMPDFFALAISLRSSFILPEASSSLFELDRNDSEYTLLYK